MSLALSSSEETDKYTVNSRDRMTPPLGFITIISVERNSTLRFDIILLNSIRRSAPYDSSAFVEHTSCGIVFIMAVSQDTTKRVGADH